MLHINKSIKEYDGKTILITGGTGSLGNKLVEVLFKYYKPRKIIIFSRDEYKQSVMQSKFPMNKYNIRFFLGDIRDQTRLEEAFRNVDIIFHTAALKQVPPLEYNPMESIKTNIYGAENVIRAAIKNKVHKIMAISTDKAVNPINLYGATKLCFERLFVSANNLTSDTDTIFSVARYGNVLGSRGSVLPLFLRQKDSGKFTITDKNMTRFTITLRQAVGFILNCTAKMVGAEIFIPKLPSYNIMQMARVVNKDAEIDVIGIRSGEKMHESLVGEDESYLGLEFKDYIIIGPCILTKKDQNHCERYDGYRSMKSLEGYNSGKNELIDDDKLRKYIKNYNRSLVVG